MCPQLLLFVILRPRLSHWLPFLASFYMLCFFTHISSLSRRMLFACFFVYLILCYGPRRVHCARSLKVGIESEFGCKPLMSRIEQFFFLLTKGYKSKIPRFASRILRFLEIFMQSTQPTILLCCNFIPPAISSKVFVFAKYPSFKSSY